MPLILITGYPCSGKTTRALELKSYFEEYQKDVVLINEENLSINKIDAYKGFFQNYILFIMVLYKKITQMRK